MATPKETLWALEPHTLAKHAILRKYLEAWFPILGKHNDRIIYIDGFSGPGRYKGGEPGSPLIVLELAVKHASTLQGDVVFLFIEERQDRVDHLREELSAIQTPKNFRIKAECGQFDQKLTEMLDLLESEGKTLAPTFVFIDPFGFAGLPFTVVERLMGFAKCEVFITFMFDSINRFLSHPADGIRHQISDVFGTEQATKIVESSGDRITELRALYQSQLQRVARFVRYFEMRDANDRPKFDLFFGSNSETGHVKMKEAMWRVDPEGTFRFSDATNPNQLILLQRDESPGLNEAIRKEFLGKGEVSGGDVRRFVENETAFLGKHMRGVLKTEERAGRLSVNSMKSDGTKRVGGSFPDESKMTFRVEGAPSGETGSLFGN